MAVMTMFIAVMVLCVTACQRKPVMATSSFVNLPAAGWMASAPLSFTPAYGDSSVAYDLILAVRHSNGYRYRNLSLVADVIDDHATASRKTLDISLADEFGNWSGGGFGSLYQATVPLASGVTPQQARHVVVWHTMAGCDTLLGLVNVGIIARPKL